MNRISVLDLYRFIGCIGIMLCHLYAFGTEPLDNPFRLGYMFVEFFFCVSGFVTFSHFINKKADLSGDIAKNSIEYTAKKFSYFFPYLVVIMPIITIYDYYIDRGVGLHSFLMMFYDIFFIRIGQFWFLSAMFILFPLFCCFCQIRSKYFVYIISVLYCIIYYKCYNRDPNFPLCLFRTWGACL